MNTKKQHILFHTTRTRTLTNYLQSLATSYFLLRQQQSPEDSKCWTESVINQYCFCGFSTRFGAGLLLNCMKCCLAMNDATRGILAHEDLDRSTSIGVYDDQIVEINHLFFDE